MAVRSVSVRYSASVGALVSELNRAAAANTRVADAAEKAGASQQRSATKATSAAAKAAAANKKAADAAKAASDAAEKAANRQAKAGAVVAFGLGVAIAKFAEFDAAMSGAQAASMTTGAELNNLRDAAVKAGADTQYSATEAANAITELSKAGVSSSEILGGALTGALNLAAAGQMDVAEAAETAATAMTQFSLHGDQVNHIADLLAAGANKAQGGVSDLGMALKQAGLVASQTGLSIEETTAGLTAFASAGLIGSDAGTSMKSMLQRLTPTSNEAAQMMADLGISAYDASGNFIGLEKFAGNLQTSLRDLTPEQRNSAMATIFGSDAVRAASVLYNEGADGIRRWTGEVNAQGYAAKQAAMLTDNLKGDLERLGGSFDTVLIQTGSGANSSLRSLVQTGEALVNVLGTIPGPVLTGVTAFTALALLGPKVGRLAATVTGPLNTSLANFRTQAALAQAKALGYGVAAEGAGVKSLTAGQRIRTLGSAMGGLKGAAGGALSALGGPWGVAMLAATAGITMWAQAQADAKARVEALTGTVDEQTGAFTDASRANVRDALMGDLSPSDQALLQGLGVDFNALADAALKGGPAFEEQKQKLADLMAANQGITNFMSDASFATEGLLNSFIRQGAAADDTRTKLEVLAAAKQQDAIANSNGAGSANAAEGAQTKLGDAATKTGAALGKQGEETDGVAELLGRLGAKSEDAKKQLDALKTAIDLLGGGTRALQAAQDAQAAAIDKVREAAEKATEATKKKTDKDYTAAEKTRDVAAANREYRAALRGVAEDTLARINVQKDENKSVGDLTSSYEKGRAEITRQLAAHGFHGKALQAETDKIIGTRGQFQDLLDTYKKTPPQVATEIRAKKVAEAKYAVKEFIGVVNGVPQYKTVTFEVNVVKNITERVDKVLNDFTAGLFKADGGAIVGPGSGTSDDIPAWLSNGEHVLTADDVKDAGGHAAIYRMRKAIQSGDLAFAGGGPVGHPGLAVGAYATGGAVAPLDSFYGDFIATLGEQVTAAILAELRAGVAKAVSDQGTRTKAAGTRRTNTAATLRQDREKIADAQHDVRAARSKSQRAAAQKRLAAAEDKYDKDRRNAALATVKEDKAIVAGKAKIAAAQKAVTDAQARQKRQAESPLTKFGKALSGGVKNTGAFIANIQKLASRGYVTLAQQLAGMSNEDAEKIAAQAAGASTATLNGLQANVATAITQQQKLDHIDTITAILGATRTQNLTARQLATATGIDVMEVLDAAALIKGDLSKNRNASKLLADLAKRSRGQLFSTGGAVFGAGTETSDDIPAWLSANEHVWTGREVRGAGGHAVVARLRAAAAAGSLPRFAAGGPVRAVASGGFAPVDLAVLAALIREGGGDTFNAYGIPDEAIQRAIRQKEFKQMSRLL